MFESIKKRRKIRQLQFPDGTVHEIKIKEFAYSTKCKKYFISYYDKNQKKESYTILEKENKNYYTSPTLYTSQRPKIEIEMPAALQRGIANNDIKQTGYEQEYYIAKIEQEMLLIYKMPEESIYDSLKISNLQFQEKDYLQLKNGIVFQSLAEVFEFLESCMS